MLVSDGNPNTSLVSIGQEKGGGPKRHGGRNERAAVKMLQKVLLFLGGFLAGLSSGRFGHGDSEGGFPHLPS